MNLLYISTDYIALSVFKSQVHSLCNSHSQNLNVNVIALCNKFEYSQEQLTDTQYTLHRFHRLPKLFIPFVCKQNAKKIQSATLFEQADIILCRGHVGAMFCHYVLKQFKIKAKVIVDIRGALPEELMEKPGLFSSFWARQAKKTESLVFSHFQDFFMVSKNMENFYREKYSSIQNISIFPTLVNTQLFVRDETFRNVFRKKHNWTNKYVYTYCGGMDYWQNLDKIIDTFASVQQTNSSVAILIISRSTKEIEEYIQSHCPQARQSIYITSLEYEEVGKYLSVADCGLLIRSQSIVNHVASPTKINEYTSVGLDIMLELSEIGNKGTNPSKFAKAVDSNNAAQQQQQIFKTL